MTRRGSVTFWILLSLGAIIGFLALLMDGGRMMEERRRAQAGADAAALAAAFKLYDAYPENGRSAAQVAALASAALNGYANDGLTSTVAVNVPPTSGPYAGNPDCVEIVVESTLPGGFGKLLSGQDLLVRARAVARGRPARTGLLVLQPSGAGTFVNSALAFALLGSSIIVNSSDPAALQNAGVILTANSFEINGGFTNAGIMLGKTYTGTPPTADPLRYLPLPNSAGQPVQSTVPLTINSLIPTILKPGLYQGGIKIMGLSVVVLQPGIYVLEGGGLDISGLATVTGVGVLFYNTAGAYPAGPISIAGLGKIVITAPGAGTYRGINVVQDRNVNQPISLTGSGTTVVSGLIYAPAAPVSLKGALAIGVDTLGGAYICSTFSVSGIGSLNLDLGNNLPQIPEVNLVD